ncbi:hypothetical protein BCR32DRAFT_326473 [Anaeromyces robustus]|jgi:hypothetical protein|uniref:Uncharacterized protein n=1 Tax=Anaeromyces robustus TaxID=1754192 RepID=A0A1Y1XBQ9_9FUNG|nr:hypothetical protein BCR32DRAFT_326473 [Anaeromyces robustus]|eukprot:ORX83221.1 hypothetical protein BCR32DRAFT_326473 [Anaeromyces robustus]
MNFKTILSVSALALLSAAAPVSKDVKTLKSECQAQKGLFINKSNNSDYVCLQPNFNEANLDNAACINVSEQIFCINPKITNIEECDRSSDDYVYEACLDRFNKISSIAYYPILSFSKKDEAKFAENKKKCVNNLGIYLEWDDDKKLNACLYPEFNFKSLDDEHCVTVTKIKENNIPLHGIKYCVVEDMTSIPACKKSHEHYNTNGCSRFLDAMASFQAMDISV